MNKNDKVIKGINMPNGQHDSIETEEENDEATATPSQQQLDSILGMYRSCLKKQSNYARMYAGTSQATPLPGAGGLYKKHPDPAGYRDAFHSVEETCDSYKKQWDDLYKRLYKR
jgi:hypothetical protein